MRVEETHRLIRDAVAPLVDLRVAASYRAADMLILHFGEVHETDGGSVGDFSLHIQSPWRLEDAAEIITGRYDRWHDPSTREPAYHGPELKRSLWDDRIERWLKTGERSPKVVSVRTDRFATLKVTFNDGTRLRSFADGTQTEDWRLLQPLTDKPHFVVVGGKIEADEHG